MITDHSMLLIKTDH